MFWLSPELCFRSFVGHKKAKMIFRLWSIATVKYCSLYWGKSIRKKPFFNRLVLKMKDTQNSPEAKETPTTLKAFLLGRLTISDWP